MKLTFSVLVTLMALSACTPKPIPFPEEPPDYYSLTLFDRINRYRSACGLASLQWDPALAQLAREHSISMFRSERASHRGFDKRHRQAGSWFCVENVGWNYRSPQSMFEGWRRSDDHNDNMLDARLNRAGIAEIDRYVTFFACR
jgi:uncharacterized protein YkwD